MITVYGIPTCDTVRKARRHLDEQGVAHTFVDFRADPVGRERIEAWVASLGAKALRNTSGQSYRALPDDKAGWSDARWVEAFAGDPMLLKRPVIERDGVAVQAGFRGSVA
jgi:arsenate reductase